jgi:surface carbohydrate biosynthesis protein
MRDLILPCETRSRELDAKLLLAVVASGRGIRSVVGSKKPVDLNLGRLSPGVYVGKSMTARSRHNLLVARACGHRIVAWDEEGLVWASRDVYWRTKVDAGTLNTPELLLAWGEDNAAAWREHPQYRGTPIAVSGNPRADLLREALRPFYEPEAQALRESYGRFVLVNTNFSRVNHMQPRQNRHLRWLREQRPDDPRGGFAAHKFTLYQAFLELMPRLSAALPETTIVVRPHPSESLAVWQALAERLPNLVVRREGGIAPWLLAAEAMVHNGCTTAVEAFALGCPALAYAPERSALYDHPLPNGLSVPCANVDALVSRLESCLRDRQSAYRCQSADEQRRALIRRSIAGFDAPDSASERVCTALSPLLEASASAGPRRWRGGLVRVGLAARRHGHRFEQRIPGTSNYRPYLQAMFPDTVLGEVQAHVSVLAGCMGVPVPAVKQLETNVFVIEPGGGKQDRSATP